MCSHYFEVINGEIKCIYCGNNFKPIITQIVHFPFSETIPEFKELRNEDGTIKEGFFTGEVKNGKARIIPNG